MLQNLAMSGGDTRKLPLLEVQACVFDAYGTLFDFGTAASRCPGIPPDKVPALTALWRDKQLQYTWLRAIQDRHSDFWSVTRDALDFAMETLGISDEALRDQLMTLYLTLLPFPEVSEVLTQLKRAGLKIAVLSNGSPAMLKAAVDNAGIAGLLDAVLSVEDVGVFKPHARVYQLAVDKLGVPAQAISFQSSNAWDAFAASAFGMRVVWCNRYGQRRERLPGVPDREIRTLSELPALVVP